MVRWKENVSWGTISFKKDTENFVLLQVEVLMQIFVKFRAEKIIYTCLSCTKCLFEGCQILCTERFCINPLNQNELEVNIPLKDNKLACFANS